jgi:hypothetical protein
MMKESDRQGLLARGIVPQPYAEVLPENWRENPGPTLNRLRMAYDAQPQTITAQNVGIPAYLANLLDPQMIRVLVTPMKAALAYSEVKKGEWTTVTAQFPVVETTGQVAAYSDYQQGGAVDSNYNWVPRQSFHVQTVSQYGDLETEMFGLAQINYVADVGYSSALVLNKWLNKDYLFGLEGPQNYGALNDSSLSAPITPSTKLAGGTTWAVAQAYEIMNDGILLYTQLQTQLQGYALDRDTPMTMVLPPTVEPNLGKGTQYTLVSVRSWFKENFPNMRIITVPETATPSGNLIQLFVDEIDGVRSVYCAFTEKLRAGRIVPELSAFRQKKIGGGWGAIWRRPIACAQMLGV